MEGCSTPPPPVGGGKSGVPVGRGLIRERYRTRQIDIPTNRVFAQTNGSQHKANQTLVEETKW